MEFFLTCAHQGAAIVEGADDDDDGVRMMMRELVAAAACEVLWESAEASARAGAPD